MTRAAFGRSTTPRSRRRPRRRAGCCTGWSRRCPAGRVPRPRPDRRTAPRAARTRPRGSGTGGGRPFRAPPGPRANAGSARGGRRRPARRRRAGRRRATRRARRRPSIADGRNPATASRCAGAALPRSRARSPRPTAPSRGRSAGTPRRGTGRSPREPSPRSRSPTDPSGCSRPVDDVQRVRVDHEAGVGVADVEQLQRLRRGSVQHDGGVLVVVRLMARAVEPVLRGRPGTAQPRWVHLRYAATIPPGGWIRKK